MIQCWFLNFQDWSVHLCLFIWTFVLDVMSAYTMSKIQCGNQVLSCKQCFYLFICGMKRKWNWSINAEKLCKFSFYLQEQNQIKYNLIGKSVLWTSTNLFVALFSYVSLCYSLSTLLRLLLSLKKRHHVHTEATRLLGRNQVAQLNHTTRLRQCEHSFNLLFCHGV